MSPRHVAAPLARRSRPKPVNERMSAWAFAALLAALVLTTCGASVYGALLFLDAASP